ncbi:MAG TPA: tetratricopeptide repeat protein [Anaerolineales bacterium]|jgi:superkiller protein 3
MSNYEFWDELGKIFEAVVAYQEKSVEFNKRFIHPWIKLGNVFDKQDRNSEGVRAYQQAIELEPGNAQNWYELGNLHFQMNAHAEAAEAYQKAIELAPESGWAYSNLALTLATQAKFVEAVPLYQKGIELLQDRKDQAVAWNRLGNAYRKLDQYELALEAFQKADELDEENAGFRDALDEVAEGPSLVEGIASENADAAVEMIVEPVLLSLAEDTPVVEPIIEDDAPAAETVVEQIEVAIETVVTTDDVRVEETVLLEVERVVADPEPESAHEEVAAAEAVSVSETTQSLPAWISDTVPVEIEADQPEDAAAEQQAEVEPALAVVNETTAVAEEIVVESAEQASAVEVTVVVSVQEGAETFTETVVIADVATDTQEIAAVAEALSSTEKVAAVDAQQSYDEIVVTAEGSRREVPAPAVAETAAPAGAVSEESLEVAATEPEVPSEAVQVEVAVSVAVVETVEAPAVETTPHAAYDEYLKDSEPELESLVAQSAKEAVVEESSAASQEPVAQIGPSGDIQIEMDTKNAHVWNELGNVYFGTAAYDDAIVAYTKAIELDRWFAWPYSNLALAYVQKGRFAEATLLYQRSIELFASDKDKAISWNRLGNVYRRLNDYENAIAAYQRADELDPENTTLSLQSRFSLLGNFHMEQKPSYAA